MQTARFRCPFEFAGRLLVLAVAWLLPSASIAACDVPVGRLVSAEAVVVVRAAGTEAWSAVRPPHALCEGDQVSVREPGRAAVVLQDDVLVRLDARTTLLITRAARDADAELGLAEGIVHLISRLRKRVGVSTPYVNALVDGTEFSVSALDGKGRIVVAEGAVRARNAQGETRLQAGEGAEAGPGAAPAAIVIRPLDAVRWAIHYPQIAWLDEGQLARLPADVAKVVADAQRALSSGRHAEALAMLEALPPASVSAPVEALRVGTMLALGRVDAARERLARSAGNDGAGNEDATLVALDVVILVARNEGEAARSAAQRAVQRAPDSAAARLALSYALQSRFELEGALEAAQTATRLAPDNPFAWARRAELELGLARLERGRQSAMRALELADMLPRARALVGFAQLLGGESDAARTSFDAAIAADSADPLACFGRGLAYARAGELQEARRSIELAVLLDPGNAELRSYLGRVYVEEDRSPLASEQFALARRLDPASPTPWHFDALRRLRDKDPLAAIDDGWMAIALNDRRAVFRSPALLDGDRAARSATLGAAYREVGFDQAMLHAAMRTLQDDVQNAAGHRLLAEAYAETPRFETARSSELLQAQLRQPVGQWPVPPQFLSPNLPIAGGPRSLAPEEAGALFDRKPYHFSASVLGGDHGTWGDSLVAARAFDNAQLSLGHFDYRRDGLRRDGDIELSGTRLDAQYMPATGTMLYGELGYSERRGGDVLPRLLEGVGLAWDGRLQDVTTSRGRVSLRHTPSEQSEFIVTAGAQEVDERVQDNLSRDLGGFAFDVELRSRVRLDASDVGLLYGLKGAAFDAMAGATTYHESRRQSQSVIFGGVPFPLPASRESVNHTTAFSRLTLKPTNWASLHLGVSYARFSADGPEALERVNGQAGLTLNPTQSTTLRIAAMQGVKGPKYRDQVIEPTQFAGFNQVFDDLDGTRWRRLGLGLDHRFGNGVAAGFEWSRRVLDVPRAGCGTADCVAAWQEGLHRAYLVVPIGDRFALSAAWRYEGLRLEDDPVGFASLPYRTRTEVLPLGAWMKLSPQWSARIEAVRVRQQATIVDDPAPTSRTEHAWLANARASYWSVDRRFGLALAIHNLFDRRIALQDTDLNGNPRVPLFHPRRAVVLQATVQF